jgi:hypothetical protein
MPGSLSGSRQGTRLANCIQSRQIVPNSKSFQIPNFAKYLAIACVIVALLLALVLWNNRGAQVRLESKILKTRLIPADDASTLAVLEVRITNPSNVTFVVRDVHVKVILADATELDGDQVAQMDLDRVLDGLKIHGPRYNPVLKAKDSFTGSWQGDRTVVAIFPRSAAEIERRKGFVIVVDDVDGAVTRWAEVGAEGK